MIHVTNPTTRCGQTTRSRIVEMAYQIFAEEGIRAVRTRNVALRAKINVSTLHYSFPTQLDLLLAVLDGLLIRLREQAAHTATPSQELNAAIASSAAIPLC